MIAHTPRDGSLYKPFTRTPVIRAKSRMQGMFPIPCCFITVESCTSTFEFPYEVSVRCGLFSRWGTQPREECFTGFILLGTHQTQKLVMSCDVFSPAQLPKCFRLKVWLFLAYFEPEKCYNYFTCSFNFLILSRYPQGK